MVGIIPTEPEQPLVAETKCCTKCGEVKALTEFYFKNKKKSDQRATRCKKCCIAVETERQKNGTAWGCKPENKEKKNARWREKYHENPEKFRAIALAAFYKRHDAALSLQRQRYHENPEKAIARSLKWNRENPDKVKAWKDENPDAVKAIQKKYAQSHPEAASLSRGKRRAYMMKAKVERIKPGIDGRLMALQKGVCPYCRVDLNTVAKHRDHIIPISRGGTHAEGNLQLTCKPCNLRKHAKHPFDFAAEMGIVQNPIYIPI